MSKEDMEALARDFGITEEELAKRIAKSITEPEKDEDKDAIK